MSRFVKAATLWLWGGCLYVAIELAWRGRSHPAMFAVGGLAFLAVGAVNNYLPWSLGLLWQSLLGGAAITAIELVSGLILNVALGLRIWDYSGVPLNLWGQICLPYSLAWVALSVVAILLDDWLRYWIFGEDKPHYKLI